MGKDYFVKINFLNPKWNLNFLTKNLLLKHYTMKIPFNVMAPTYLLLPLGKWGSKWGHFHWAMGCV